MLQINNLTIKSATANHSDAMDAGTHFKNWAKSLASRGHFFITAYFVLLLLFCGCDNNNRSITFTDSRGNEVAIPYGEKSCAMRVVSFTPGTPWTSDPRAMDPDKILGIPDYDEIDDINYITLGDGGVIVLEFGVFFTDGAGNDIYVFEIGDNVEATKVEVSADLENWYYVGDADGSSSGVDMKGKVPEGSKFKYIRLTDLYSAPGGYWPGADIDAVAVLYPVME